MHDFRGGLETAGCSKNNAMSEQADVSSNLVDDIKAIFSAYLQVKVVPLVCAGIVKWYNLPSVDASITL